MLGPPVLCWKESGRQQQRCLGNGKWQVEGASWAWPSQAVLAEQTCAVKKYHTVACWQVPFLDKDRARCGSFFVVIPT